MKRKVNQLARKLGCTIAAAPEVTSGNWTPDKPRLEVTAPDGMRFDNGCHSLMCTDW